MEEGFSAVECIAGGDVGTLWCARKAHTFLAQAA
jgi:hypothetical protein